MARIIKHGNTVTPMTCPFCEAVIEFNKRDLHKENKEEQLMGWHYSSIHYYVCPECEEKIFTKVIIDGIDFTKEWQRR